MDKTQSEGMKEYLTRIRRDIHKYPETAWTEYRTTALVAAELEKMGYQVLLGEEILDLNERAALPSPETLAEAEKRAAGEGVPPGIMQLMAGGKTGVVGILKRGPGRVTALRVDMDALEVTESTEETHVPFKQGFASCHSVISNEGSNSRTGSICHACGHDAHTAIGLGIARLLAEDKGWHGTLKLIFQPGEEGMRGARAMTMKGIVDDVDDFFGLHVGIRALETGEIVTGCDGFLATSKLDAIFRGVPAHAGICPQEGKSALLAAAAACLGMQGIARHGDGSSRINIGGIQAGSNSRNVVPDYGIVKFETRGATTEINRYMENEARRICQGAAQMYGTSVEIRGMGSAEGSDSDEELMQTIGIAARENKRVTKIVHKKSFDACEDVTCFMNRVRSHGGKAAVMMLGSRLAAGHHSGSFDIDEAAMEIGVEVLGKAVIMRLNQS